MRTWNSTHVVHNELVVDLVLGAPMSSTNLAMIAALSAGVPATCKTSSLLGRLAVRRIGKSALDGLVAEVDDAAVADDDDAAPGV